MVSISRKTSFSRIADLVAFDLIVVLFLIWVINGNPRRWPVLFVLIPAFLLVNFILGRRAFGTRSTTSYALPAIYSCGLIYGIWLVVEDFTWWKLVLLVVPLTLIIFSVKRSMMARKKVED